jgi:hypothetical protein
MMTAIEKKLALSCALILLLLAVGCSGGPVVVTAVTQENPTPAASAQMEATATTNPPPPAGPPAATAAPDPTTTIPPEPTALPEPTESPGTSAVEEPDVAPPRDETIAIAGVDGLMIQTTLKTPAGNAPFPGVVLLHMLGSNRAVWEEVGLQEQLLRRGYAVLAVDMRGHGESGGERDWVLAEDGSAAGLGGVHGAAGGG